MSDEKRVDHEFVPHPKGPDHYSGCTVTAEVADESGPFLMYCGLPRSAHTQPAPQESPGETERQRESRHTLIPNMGLSSSSPSATPSASHWCKWFQYDPASPGRCIQCGRERGAHVQVVAGPATPSASETER